MSVAAARHHGDSALCCGFGMEAHAILNNGSSFRLAIFFKHKPEYRAHSTLKPGHIALSTRRAGSLFWVCTNFTGWPFEAALCGRSSLSYTSRKGDTQKHCNDAKIAAQPGNSFRISCLILCDLYWSKAFERHEDDQ